ncbi:hypothetical protein E4T50_06734 [Aureobasidium sp. EXF-12298]|nr:hypothetical protein E4T50_06734 [Aureobasidium sp. EXF-12298]
MPPCLYICCHIEISDEQHDPPSRLKEPQDSRRISRRYSTNRERPRERSRAVRQRHRSHHRSPSASRTHNNHTTTLHSPSQEPQNHALTTHNLIFLDQSPQHPRFSHKPTQKSSNKSSHKPTHKSQQLQEQKKQQQQTPLQTKQNYIAKWLSGLRSMSSLLSSSSRTRGSGDGESSSVEVVKARDAKGRGKGIRIVSDDVEKEECTGVGGEGKKG